MLQIVYSYSDYPVIDRSDALYRRAKEIIPAAMQSLARGPDQHVSGVSPKYLARGKGSHVWDVDGNEFLDYSMGIGPFSLGYCYGRVDDAIRQQLASVMSSPSPPSTERRSPSPRRMPP
jgi:glutamate-1-semialdehyde aminotransferase